MPSNAYNIYILTLIFVLYLKKSGIASRKENVYRKNTRKLSSAIVIQLRIGKTKPIKGGCSLDKEQFVVRTDGGVRIGTSGMIDGKVVLHVKQGKKQDCILLERLIEKIHHAAANDTTCSNG